MLAIIKGFFVAIDHDWLIRMLELRIADKAFLRLIKKWLKAGVLDTDGMVKHPVTGCLWPPTLVGGHILNAEGVK